MSFPSRGEVIEFLPIASPTRLGAAVGGHADASGRLPGRTRGRPDSCRPRRSCRRATCRRMRDAARHHHAGDWTTGKRLSIAEQRKSPNIASVSGTFTAYTIYRPSLDQSSGHSSFGESSSGVSSPTPLVFFSKISRFPFRSDAKAIRSPSGDQTTLPKGLSAGSNVNGVETPRAQSMSQMSCWGLPD